MTRTSRRLAAAGLAALLLSACGDGQMRPGAAAFIGDERITADQLQETVERSLADPASAQANGGDRDAFQRSVLQRLISSRVLAEAAKRKGVEATDGEIDAALERFAQEVGGRQALEQSASQAGVAPQDLRPVVGDIVVQEELGDVLTEDADVPQAQLQAAYDQNIAQYDQVRARHILVADEALARTTLDQVRADPSRFAELAMSLSTDEGSKAAGGDLGSAGKGKFVEPFENALFALTPGSYDVVKTDFGWHVINLIERKTTSLAEATPELRRTLLEEQRGTAVGELLQSTSKELGVKVNPRFGEWDAETGKVVPADSTEGVLSPAPRAPDSGSAGGGPGDEGQQDQPQLPAPGQDAPAPAPDR